MINAFFYRLVLTIVLLLLTLPTQAQTHSWKWVEHASGTNTQIVQGISVDEISGGIFAVGSLAAISPEYPSITSIYGATDGFVAKYDSLNGNVLWAFHIGGIGNDAVNDVSVDPVGDIYITGSFTGNNVEFRGTSGLSVQRSSVGGEDAFVAKYDPAGRLIWVVTNDGGTGDDEGAGIYAHAGGVVMTGFFTAGAGFQFNPWPGNGAGSERLAFVVSFSTTGTLLWGVNAHGNGSDSEGVAVTMSGTNTIIVGNYINGNLHFHDNLGNNTAGNLGAAQGQDIFLVSVDNAGLVNWQERIRGINTESIGGITADATNFYLTGGIGDTARFPGSGAVHGGGALQHYFLSCHATADATTTWVVDLPTTGGDAFGLDITNDGAGNLYAIGKVEGTLDLSAFSVSDIVASGTSAIGILSFDDAGNFQWVKEGNGAGDNLGNEIDAYLGSDAVAAGGWYTNVVGFDTFSLPLSTNEDIWVGLLGGCEHGGNTMPGDQTICTGTTPAPLNATPGSGGGGTIVYLWEESADNISFSSASGTNTNEDYTFPGPLTTTAYYRRLVSSTGCLEDTNISAVVTITVDQAPSAAAAGVDQQLCAATTATLAATAPTVGTGNWVVITGGGSVTTPGAANSGVTSLSIGSNEFEWTVSNGVCSATIDTIEIEVFDNPSAAVAGPDQPLCATTTATLAATAPTVGTGTWATITGGGSVTTPGTANSGVTSLSIGSNEFEWTVRNGVCSATIDTIEIVVFDNPSAAVAGPDQPLCAVTTATLAATAPTVGAGNWVVITGGGSVTTPGAGNSGVTGLSIGSNEFEWTVSNGICPAILDTIEIIVFDNPSAAVAGPDQPLCAVTTATLAATAPTVGAGIWVVITGGGSVTTPGAANSGVTSLSIGSNEFEWTVSNGVCPATIDTIEIEVFDNPSAAVAGPDQPLCAVTTSTLAATAPAVGAGNWVVITGGGSVTTPGAANSGVTGLSIGSNEFEWTVSNGICPATLDTIEIIVFDNPSAAVAGPDQPLCAVTTATLAATAPTVGTGNWVVITGGGSVTTPGAANSGVTGLSIGSNEFEWTVSNGVCSATLDTIEIEVFDNPSAAVAGPDQPLCAVTTATLAATAPAVGAGNWVVITGGGSVTTPGAGNSGVTGLSIGSNEFEWTVSNGICPATLDTIEIIVFDNPSAAVAGPDQPLCAVTTATLAAIAPTVGTGNWVVITGGGSVITPGATNSGVTGLGIGSNEFEWTVSNGVCSATIDTVEIVIDEAPTASNAGMDQLICVDSSVFAGNLPLAGTGTWSLVSGSGIPTSPGLSNSTITGLGIGTNLFEWVITNGSCPASRDTLEFKVEVPPSPAVAGIDQQICQSSSVLNATPLVVGTGSWTINAGPGSLTTAGNATTGISGLGFGLNEFIWTVTNGTCIPNRDTIEVFVDTPPSPANAGMDQQLCADSSALVATAPAVGVGAWTILSGGGTVVDTTLATSMVTNMSIGQNQYVWTVSNGACPSTVDTVVITVDQIPSPAFAGLDQQLCADSSVLAATSPAVGLGAWTIVSGGGTIADTTLATSTVTNMNIGLNAYSWTVSNGTCPSTVDTVAITVDQGPSPADAGMDQQLCADSSVFTATTPAVGLGAWTVLSGGGTIADTTLATSLVTNMNIGQNQFVWTVSNGSCPSTVDTVVIAVDQVPSPADAGMDQQLCADSSAFTATTPVIGVGAWTVLSGGGSIANTTSATSLVTNMNIGLNAYSWTVSNGTCPSTVDTVVITVDQGPSPADAGMDQQLCADSSAFTASTPVIGAGAWTILSGGGSIADTTLATSLVTNMSIGQNQFVWTVSNGICPSIVDTVVITVDQVPSPADAGMDQQLCADNTALTATAPVVGAGFWTVLLGGGTIVDTTSATSVVGSMSLGQNAFVWTVSNGTCPSTVDTVEIIVYPLTPNAEVGPDQEICADMAGIFANDPGSGTGIWTSLNPNVNVLDSVAFNTLASNLDVGNNQFVWTISSFQCPSTFDTLTIFRYAPPSAADAGLDQIDIDNQPIQLAGNIPVVGSGVWTLVSGQGSIVDGNDANSLAYINDGDSMVLAWTISNGICPVTTDEVFLKLGEVLIPTGFSPNGDGRNETFVVRGFGNGDAVQVKIMNRWGNVVYQTDDYKNDWTGLNASGAPLSDDTYYVLLTSGESTHAGYVVIKR